MIKTALTTIAQMCGATLSLVYDHNLLIDKVVIDSREVKDGCLFIALKGANSDGHDYVLDILERYNCSALVNESFVSNRKVKNLMSTKDTVISLANLARNYRSKFNIPVIAITGSNGKTTVKEMLKAICQIQFGINNVLATVGNLNNHLGVPLTLLNMETRHQIAIIEMGMNHRGELKYLTQIAQPTHVIVNNVMLAHLEFFNDLEQIAVTKGEIYSNLNFGAIAVVNLQEKYASLWLKQLTQEYNNNDISILKFGSPNHYAWISEIDGHNFVITTTDCGRLMMETKLIGIHNIYNALSAVTLALSVGCTAISAIAGIKNCNSMPHRLELKTAISGMLIVDDCYNANPDSVQAAILAMQNLAQPHWLLFADLAELGESTAIYHQQLGKFIAEHQIARLICYGKLASIAGKEFAARGGDVYYFEEQQQLVNFLSQELMAYGTILVKGSHAMKLFDVIDKISK